MENPIDIAKSVFDTVSNSGTAIFRTDVGYAIVGQTSEAIQRIFEYKKRSFKNDFTFKIRFFYNRSNF